MLTPDQSSRADAPESRTDRIAALFQSIDKLLKGMQLYEGKGPLVERLQAEVLQRAAAALGEGAVTVSVTPAGLSVGGRLLSEDEPPRYLFQLFCDGVRELTLSPGLTVDELARFATVLGSDPRQTDDDMVTLLWRQELKTIRYYAVDTLSEDMGAELEEASAELEALSQGSGAQLSGSADGSAELVLSASDMRVLKAEDRMQWARLCAAPPAATGAAAETAARIRGAFRSPRDYPRFVGIALSLSTAAAPSPLLLSTLDALVAAGDAAALAELYAAVDQAARSSGPAAEALRAAALSEARMQRLAPVYDAHHDTLTAPLRAITGARPADREALVLLLKALPTGDAQEQLLGALSAEGVDMTPYYLRHLDSEDTADIVRAVGALGRIGSPRAIKAISAALGHHLTAVRRAALEAMDGRYDPGARVALGRVLRDPDRTNRLLALAVLRASGDRRLGGPLLGAMQHSSFGARDAEEKTACFEALTAFQDARTIGFLDGVLRQKNLTRSAALAQQQRMAVAAIAAIGTAQGREVLRRCAEGWLVTPDIKHAAAEALAGMPRD